MLRALIVIAIVILAVVGGLYVGVWLMFIGGLIDIIEAIKAPVTEAMPLAIGVVKMFFAGVVGWVVAIAGFFLAGLASSIK